MILMGIVITPTGMWIELQLTFYRFTSLLLLKEKKMQTTPQTILFTHGRLFHIYLFPITYTGMLVQVQFV